MVGLDHARTEAAGAEEHGRTGASGAELQNPGGGRSKAAGYLPAGLRPGCGCRAFPSWLGWGHRAINGYFIYIISGVP